MPLVRDPLNGRIDHGGGHIVDASRNFQPVAVRVRRQREPKTIAVSPADFKEPRPRARPGAACGLARPVRGKPKADRARHRCHIGPAIFLERGKDQSSQAAAGHLQSVAAPAFGQCIALRVENIVLDPVREIKAPLRKLPFGERRPCRARLGKDAQCDRQPQHPYSPVQSLHKNAVLSSGHKRVRLLTAPIRRAGFNRWHQS